MESRIEELASYVNLASEGLTTLAGMIDRSIQESVLLRKAQGDRRNPSLLHGLIREGVIVAAKNSTLLGEQGITIRSGATDSIHVQIEGGLKTLRLTSRPQMSRPAENFLEPADCGSAMLFPMPQGHLRLFYSVAGEGLGRLTLTRTLSDPSDYYRDCQILDEVEIHARVSSIAPVVPEETRNDADDLSGLLRSKIHEIDEESTTDAETGNGVADAG